MQEAFVRSNTGILVRRSTFLFRVFFERWNREEIEIDSEPRLMDSKATIKRKVFILYYKPYYYLLLQLETDRKYIIARDSYHSKSEIQALFYLCGRRRLENDNKRRTKKKREAKHLKKI